MKKIVVLAGLAGLIALAVAGPAHAAARPLSLKGAREVATLNVHQFAQWKMDDGGYDDWSATG